MDQQSVRELRGVKDLTQETVDAAVVAIADAHRETARRCYAVLRRIPVIAGPVGGIEQVQQVITAGVYGSIRVVNAALGSVASHALDRLEAGAEQPEETVEP